MATATRATDRPVDRPLRVGRWHLGRAEAALLLVGLLFLVLQNVLLPRPFGFSTDEATYLAKVDPTAPELYWSPPRAWGVPVLASPVAVFSAGVEVVRTYFSVLSSVALVGAFWPWLRVLRPAVAPLAALLFSTCWFTIFFGPQPMPNLFVGLGAVGITGLFLRAVQDPSRRRLVLAAAAVAVVALIRPTDSVLVVAPVVAVALVVRRLRRPGALAALVVGGVLGWLPWIAEAFVRFGDPITRLTAAEEAGPKGLALDPKYLFALPRFIDGSPYYITPTTANGGGPVNPQLSVWLLAVVVLVAVGLVAAARQRRLPELLVTVLPAGLLSAFYLLLPSFTSIRFILPVFALLSVPVATALVFLVESAGRRRRLATGVVAAGVLLHVVMMGIAARANFEGSAVGRTALIQVADAVRPYVQREHCMIVGQEPQSAAYYLGCRVQQAREIDEPQSTVQEAIAAGEDVLAVLRRPVETGYLTTWERVDIPGLPGSYQAFRPPA